MGSEQYRDRPHFRYGWWHRADYMSPMYRGWTAAERQIMDHWYDASDPMGTGGEMSIPMASVLTTLLGGNNIRRVVQLGHAFGYSTLVMGFCLRHMGASRSLWSVDLDPVQTEICAHWVERAGLQDYVQLHVADSADPMGPALAAQYLAGPPTLVVIDSSHQYAHTLRELDLWYPALEPGGLVALHDASLPAATFDPTGRGGVRQAILDWVQGRDLQGRWMLLNALGITPAYMDPCGLGLIQKPEE